MKSGCCSGHMRKRTFYGLFIHNNAPGRRLINCLFRFIPEGSVHTFAAWWVVLLCLFLPTGSSDSAVLYYRFTGEKEVELMSTYVPETFRGQGLAADLSRVGSHTCKMHIKWVLHVLMFTGHLFFSPTGCHGLSGAREPEGSYFLLVYKEIHSRASRGALWRTCHWLNSTKNGIWRTTNKTSLDSLDCASSHTQ